jgi:hypothetical protein
MISERGKSNDKEKARKARTEAQSWKVWDVKKRFDDFNICPFNRGVQV